MIANIDVDPLCYSVGSFTNNHPFLKESDGTPIQMPCTAEAIGGLVEDALANIQRGAECDSSVLFLSTGVSTNFRDKVAVSYPYKGRRLDNSTGTSSRPYHHQTVVSYLSSLHNTQIANNREADDDLADAQTEDTVLCTIDKDLDMVAGKHYNWKKPDKGIYTVTAKEGYRFFMYQLLVGDWSVDSILGCAKLVDKLYGPKAAKAGQAYRKREGIGPKEAETILSLGSSEGEWLALVKDQYHAMFGTEWEQKLDEMGQLLYMGGSEDNLWTYKGASHED